VLTWIVGASGLLGSAVVRASDHHFVASNIPWQDSHAALTELSRALTTFNDLVNGAPNEPWAIIWAAGRTSTASLQAEAQAELDTFAAFVDLLAHIHPVGNGCFALASSAGGIYSGSTEPPFTSRSTPSPTGVYGHAKLTQESLAQEKLASHMQVLIARIANLYGPGQDLNKIQGFISRLALSAISKEQVNIFVSLDTLRDYIYVDDAAAVLLHWTHTILSSGSPSNAKGEKCHVKLIGSGEPVSLGYLINLVQDVTRTKIPIAYGSHASSNAQSRDLRLTPDTDEVTQILVRTSLPVGVKRVYADLLSRRQIAHPMTNSLG
jgi:UDP-glucose 4-epimerase